MTARSTLRPATDSAVVVRAPGRLHLGFLDRRPRSGGASAAWGW
ncbi:hypothetical protein [Methylibium sp. T29]|nr:hypothetical protein [Methylibium sp. T29]